MKGLAAESKLPAAVTEQAVQDKASHDHSHHTHELDPLTFGAEQRCFGCGVNNERGMRLRFRREGDEVVTTYSPPLGFEGPPLVFHGGLQATLMDEIGGWTIVGMIGRMGWTTSMSVRYVRPLKVEKPVEGRGRIRSRTGPFITIDVRLLQDGKLGSSARVTYMLPDPDKAERYLGGPIPESWRRLFEESEEK